MANSAYDRDHMVRVIRSFVPEASPKVSDEAGGPLDELIQAAIDRFNVDSPRTVAAEITGDGTSSLALPATYEAGFSVVSEFEYPVGSVPRELQDERDWTVNDLAETVETPGFVVSNGATAQLTLTTPHTLYGLDGETDATSIPRSLFRALGALAASFVAERLSSYYAQTADSQFGSDVAQFRTKSQEWASRADALRKIYTAALFPKKEDGVRPRGAFVNWDIGASDGTPYTREPGWLS